MTDTLMAVLARWWHRHPNRPASREDLAAAEQRITDQLQISNRRVMGALEDLAQQVDDETTRIADLVTDQTDEITRLADELAAAEAGSDEAAELREQITAATDKLTGTAERLRAIGADPTNPVPDPTEPDPTEPDPGSGEVT